MKVILLRTKTFNLTLTFTLLIIIISFLAYANAQNTVRIVTEHLPPFQIKTTDNRIKGAIVNAISPTQKNVAPSAQIEIMPWPSAYKTALNRPNTIIFSVIRTKEKEEKFVWISHLFSIKSKFIARPESNIQPVIDLEGLKQYQIGVKKKDAVSDALLLRVRALLSSKIWLRYLLQPQCFKC